MCPLNVGDIAPGFLLKDHSEKEVSLSELKGRKVLLSFHPLAWTPVCALQMKSLEKNFSRFKRLGTVPFGVSVDTVPSKAAWAKALRLKKLQLLCDFWPHGGHAKSLGIFREANGFSERANVLLDEEGRVLWMRIYPIKELPDVEEVLAQVRKHR